MSYVVSLVHPPVGGAAFGKSAVDYVPTLGLVATATYRLITRESPFVSLSDARTLAQITAQVDLSTDIEHVSGLTVRCDPQDEAPHPCWCCERLVLPTDHALAGEEDALCTGCYTWARGEDQCLHEHSAHASGEEG